MSEPPGADSRRRRANGSRIVVVVLGLLVLFAGLVAFGVDRLSLGADDARRDVEMRLSELTGLPVTAHGSAADFHLLPVSRLSLTDMRIGREGSSGALRIAQMTADLDLWQALIGRTVVKRLVLVRPELLSSGDFVADASGRAAPAKAYDVLSRDVGELMSRFGSVTTVEIRDGTFRLGPGASSVGITNANVVLSWPAPGSAASMSATYVWSDQPTDISVSLASPLAFLRGSPSVVGFDLVSPSLSVGFQGEGAIGPAGRLKGRVRASVPSLGRAVRWITRRGPVPPDIGPLSVEADLAAANGSLDFSDARVTLNGSVGQGALDAEFDKNGKPVLGGTIAFDALDLGALGTALAPLPKTPLDFGRPIPLDFVDRMNMDLRISAATGTLGEIPVEDVAATVKFKDGTATLDIGDATILGGQGQMRVSLETRESAPALKGFLSLKGIEAARLLPALGTRSLSLGGSVDITAEIGAPVVDWAGIVDGSWFDATLTMRGGTLGGLDPNLFLSEGTRRLVLGGDTPVAFRSAVAKLEGLGARTDLRSARIVTDDGVLTAAGLLSTAAGEVDLAGTFEETVPEGNAALTSRQPIAFTMRGTWPAPDVSTAPSPKRM